MIEQRVIAGDCVDVMAQLDAESIDAVITDPPYGLEFMGKDWDKLDADLPQEAVWKGRRGRGGATVGDDDTKPGSRHHVALGGKRGAFKRCTTCGKRAFSGSPCKCDAPTWTIEYPDGPPSGMIRMQRWHEQWAREALRILKPGAHLLAFGGTRTFHRLAAGIEDAGFEIRDCLSWLYGSGFPKSLDAERAIAIETCPLNGRHFARTLPKEADRLPDDHVCPPTPESLPWEGWGTALKPAWEPCIVARKPLRGTVAANVAQYGTGGLNIDACRIEAEDGSPSVARRQGKPAGRPGEYGDGHALVSRTTPERYAEPRPGEIMGRWPANVALDEEAAAMLDAQSGERGLSAGILRNSENAIYGRGIGSATAEQDGMAIGYGDTGGASRFFYTAKASRAEREAWGRMKITPRQRTDGRQAAHDTPHLRINERINDHPTVKPIALMEWLIKLVLPEGGTVLDPFLGSGSTLVAARRLNVNAIGIEQDERSAEIARQRIAAQWEVMLIP